MKVYAVYEYAVIEYEERVRIMGVFSDEDLAAEAIREYEKNEPDWEIHEVDVRRSINRNGDGRKGKEVLITNYR